MLARKFLEDIDIDGGQNLKDRIVERGNIVGRVTEETILPIRFSINADNKRWYNSL